MPLLIARLASLWRNLVHRDQVERDLDDEMRTTLALLVDEKLRAGLAHEEALRQARASLGVVEPVKERVRDARAGAQVEMVMKDLRYAVRMLLANPGFALVAVLSLGLGIGANSAMFAVANALVWRTLPVPAPDELHTVRIDSPVSAPQLQRFSYPLVEDLRRSLPDAHGLAAMSRVSRGRVEIDGGEPEPGIFQLVSGDFFPVFGVTAAIGRLLTPEDDRAVGAHPVTVVSHAFWRRRLASRPDIVGRELTFNGARFTVVGVAAEGFSGAWLESPVDAWMPTAMQADLKYAQNFSSESDAEPNTPWRTQRGISWLELVLRAPRPDGAEAAALNAAYRPHLLDEASHTDDEPQRRRLLGQHLVLQPYAHGASNLRDRFQAPMFALMAMTAVLLLIACANTANLLLARSSSRQREMAVRLSIGASRGRVIRQLLTESVILGLVAAAVGLVLAPVASELLVRMTTGVDSGPLPFAVGVDGRVLAYTVTLSLLTSTLFGLAPAWRATDLTLAEALKSTSRSVQRGGRGRLTRGLVVVQVALSLLLVVGAGLFLRSLQNLATLPLGFASEQVISAWISPVLGGYQPGHMEGLQRRLVESAERIPGVGSASVAMCGLLSNCRSATGGVHIEGYEPMPGEDITIQENYVGPKYFETVGMTLVEGRTFEERERTHPETVAVINETAARRYFQGRSPIGRRFGEDTPNIEIVGVVRDARVNTVREAATPMAFYPLEPAIVTGTLDVRATGDPRALVESLRKAIAAVDPKLPVDRITVLADQAGTSLRQERLIARLTTVLGALALGLACLGLYGVLSYGVKQRTPELGIRFALGASRPAVLWTVLRESLVLVLGGVAIGLPLVLALSQAVGALLYDVSARNPLTLGVSVVVLLLVGASAGYLPAWRASRVDPLTALRND